jgi:hypothetical protein
LAPKKLAVKRTANVNVTKKIRKRISSNGNIRNI